MSVQISTIFTRVRSLLDDDNSARYTDAADLIPAANSALDYLASLFSAAFERKQIFPGVLSELTEVEIYTPTVTGVTAKVDLGVTFNDDTWLIIGVDPNPDVAATVLSESINQFAKRLTIEEWGVAQEDPFTPGTGQTVPSDFQRVCYTGPGNYFGDGRPYILLRPGTVFVSTPTVGVWTLKTHPTITANTSILLYPVTVHSLIEQKMLQYISYQHGDTRLFQIADKEIKELAALMNS